MRTSLGLTVLALFTLLIAGCELIVDFDRSRIVDGSVAPDTFLPPRDSGGGDATDEDGGPDDAGTDAAMDAEVPDAAMDDAGTDAAMDDAGTDAAMADGGTDATTDDAGTDAGPTMTCGNDSVEGSEACDDGNTTTETECPYGMMSCTLCNDDCTSTLSLAGRYCGDGTVDSGDSEACDDGDMDDGDGCSSSCAEESGWTCTGEPSTCSTTCGDGIVAGTETCDDFNDQACGSCNATCDGAGSGLCANTVGCAADGDCESNVCSGNVCTACTGDGECAGSSVGDQCVSGVCEVCDPVDHAGCTGTATNVCDSSSLTCRSCTGDPDCAGHTDGTTCLGTGTCGTP